MCRGEGDPSRRSLLRTRTRSGAASMYAFAPVSLGALMRADPTREHPYRVPVPKIMLPLGFAFANLIIYWGGFASTWKLAIGLLIGQLIFLLAVRLRARNVDGPRARWRSALWIWPWQIGLIILGLLGNYGDGALKVLPDDVDALIVGVFGLIVYFVTVRTVQPQADVEALVTEDLEEGPAPHGSTAAMH